MCKSMSSLCVLDQIKISNIMYTPHIYAKEMLLYVLDVKID